MASSVVSFAPRAPLHRARVTRSINSFSASVPVSARSTGNISIHVVPLRSSTPCRNVQLPRRAGLARSGRIDGLSDDAGISDYDPSELPSVASLPCF